MAARRRSARSSGAGSDCKAAASGTPLPARSTIEKWQSEEAAIGMLVTKTGLEAAAREELLLRHGQSVASIGGKLCFRWDGPAAGPTFHVASRYVRLFSCAFAEALEELRGRRGADGGNGLYEAFSRHVEHAARSGLPDSLGAKQLRFKAACRVNGRDAEKAAFGHDVDWSRLKQAVWEGVEKGTSWQAERRSQLVDIVVTAFIGIDHLLLGFEDRRCDADVRPARFLWTRVRGIGMETGLANAMAGFALDAAPASGGGTVVDLTCGRGTLLLAVARIWPGDELPLLVGRDLDARQVEICRSNLEACNLDASQICQKDSRQMEAFEAFPNGAVDAVLSDLPYGDTFTECADPGSYASFFLTAARLLRPGGRCVLLSSRLTPAVLPRLLRLPAGPAWLQLAAAPVRRSRFSGTESWLVVLERA